MRGFAPVLFLLALASVAPPAEAQSAVKPVGSSVDSDILRPGDVLRITVWRKPELSGEFQVSSDGAVASPFYMNVTIGGVRFDEAAARIRAHVLLYESQPQVLVEPLFRVSVAGEVQRPNLYTLAPSTTIAQAVLQAGGPSERGDLGRVWLYRGGVRLNVNLDRPGDPLTESSIRSGDHIVVQKRRAILKEYVLPTLLAVGATSSIARLFAR